jgi:DNA repair exonuclease SbcCD ATPase subunit
MKKYIASFNEVKDSNIKGIQENIEKYSREIEKREKNLEIARTKIAELTEELGDMPDRSVGDSLNQEIGKVRSVIDGISSTLSKLKQSRLCPVCNSPLDEGHARKHIEEMIAQKKEMEKEKLPSLMDQYKEYGEKLKTFQEKQSFIQTIRDKARTEEITKGTLETERTKAEQLLEK